MSNVSVARRYAKALLEVAGADSEQILNQLQMVTRLLETHGEFRELMTNPAYTQAQRLAVMEKVVQSVQGLNEKLSNLLKLLVQRNRMASLGDIARFFRDLSDAQLGRVRGQLTSAVPLSADVVLKLERAFERLTSRKVMMETLVDAQVLGGVAAQVGSVLYDGTLRAQLSDLRKSLTER